jgi:hypothetical protein
VTGLSPSSGWSLHSWAQSTELVLSPWRPMPFRVRAATEPGRGQTSNWGCSRSGLGSSSSENRTTEWPGPRAHSGGSRERTVPRMEIHGRPQSHVQKLLDPTKIPLCEERHIRAPLGIRRRTIKNSSDGSPSGQSGPNYTVGLQVTCVSPRPWIRAGRSTTGFRQETMLTSGAGRATSVRQIAAPSQ